MLDGTGRVQLVPCKTNHCISRYKVYDFPSRKRIAARGGERLAKELGFWLNMYYLSGTR